MSEASPREITRLLEAHERGDRGAFDQAVALVYQELRRVARGQRRRAGRNSTLNTTAIVHEAYLKLLGGQRREWKSRGHFLAVAATAMRHVAVDYAKGQRREKRGGDAAKVELDEGIVGRSVSAPERQLDQILLVDRALERLGAEKAELARVVECRYFAGMTEPETAEALDLSLRTVQRSWQTAKQMLREQLSG